MPAGDPRFVSLAEILRMAPPAVATQPLVVVVSAAEPEPPSAVVHELPAQLAALREARLFRAALGDAFDLLLAGLVRELAVHVLARELRLAGVDIASLARGLVAECCEQDPVRLRVAPADGQIVCDLPVVVDPGLRPGDAILECRSGSIDARLGIRLASVLAAVMP